MYPLAEDKSQPIWNQTQSQEVRHVGRVLGSMEACLKALPVLVIEWVGGSFEDDGLAVQHVVLPHHDLHEGFAPTEV